MTGATPAQDETEGGTVILRGTATSPEDNFPWSSQIRMKGEQLS